MNFSLPTDEKCFGCKACYNVCPVHAIGMIKNGLGFEVPRIDDSCIDCGKCDSICPSLHPVFNNSLKPEIFSFQAADEIRAESTSGGIFTLLADAVLAREGYVSGAIYVDNMQLRHILTNNRADVLKMRGSKYLQSDVGTVLQEVKNKLDSGSYVLFVGTPCQVAGLNAFLGTNYDNLVTVDLLCHGTPSQAAFDAYLNDISDGRIPVNTEFRSKRFGRTWSHTLTTFDDGSEYIGDKTDPYKKGFSKRLLWRDTCPDCLFSQGDISIGDLWGWRTLDPESQDNKGTSMVFLNNDKGQELFTEIESQAHYCKRLEIDDLDSIPNRVNNKDCVSHANRERCLHMIADYPFTKAINDSLADHYDIAMPSGLYNVNLGGVLTYYMLFYLLRDMGYSVLNLVAPETAQRKPWKPAVEFCNKHLPAYAQPVRYPNVEQMKELETKCDFFVLGSDQYLSESMCHEFDDIFLFNYVSPKKPRIAISASFGATRTLKNEEYRNLLRRSLSRFRAFSVREDSGVSFAKSILKLVPDTKWIIDPIFLADPHYLNDLADGKPKENHVGAYIIKPSEEKWEVVDRAHYLYSNLPMRVMGRADGKELRKEQYLIDNSIEPESSFPVEDALALINDSKIFITDSFHGACIAIIFKKDFVVVPRGFRDRFDTLFSRLGLTDRIINQDLSDIDLENLSFEPIDWDAVESKLEPLRKEGMEYIQDAFLNEPTLSPEKQIALLQLDVEELSERLEESEAQRQELDARIAKFERSWSRIQNTLLYRVYKKMPGIRG